MNRPRPSNRLAHDRTRTLRRPAGLVAMTVLATGLMLAIGTLAGCSDSTTTPGGPATADDDASHEPLAASTLRWEAAAERGVYGYLIYRADDRSGPFRRINPQVVRVPPGPEESHHYTYVDDTVEPGRTYHYYLDALAETGIKQRFSGIVTKTASAKDAGGSAEETTGG